MIIILHFFPLINLTLFYLFLESDTANNGRNIVQ